MVMAADTAKPLTGRLPVLRAAGGDVAGPAPRQAMTSATLQAPQYTPFQGPPVASTPGFSPFGGQAPTPTPYGDFTAPDPLNFTQDPSYQFRLNEGVKALQHGAAARGTLLTGATAKALQNYGQEAASQEYGNAFNRAMGVYNTNRDTNQQNFGQQLGSFGANLDAYTAQNNAALGFGRLGLEGQGQAYGQARDSYNDQQTANNQQTAVQNANATSEADAYAQMVEAQRRQNAATMPPPMPAPTGRRPYGPATPRR